MKTLWYKYLCLLLMTVCCLQAHADESENKGLIHILRMGLAGGGGLHLTPADCVMKSNVGGGGALAFDYAFYKSFDKVDLGLRTGLDLGYMYLPYHAEFEQHYSNVDYLNNQIDYTTSGLLDITQNQLYASVPVMFALRTHGFVCNIGVRLQMPFYQTGKQQLSNPLILAYYSKYDVTVTNELITGIVTDEQLSMPLASSPVFLECYASAEIGYEHRLNAKGAIGCAAYVHAGVWNALPKATDKPVIQVAPITDKVKPVPAVTVNDAYTSLLTSYTPLQFGVKVYYAFSL
jgi:hypothetical protein